MKPFIFEFYGNPPVAESLTNNGHSVTFTLKAVREIAFPKVIPKLLLEIVWVWAQAQLIFKKRLWYLKQITTLTQAKAWEINPPSSEVIRKIANLSERKNPQTPVYASK